MLKSEEFAPPEATPVNQASLNRRYQSYMAESLVTSLLRRKKKLLSVSCAECKSIFYFSRNLYIRIIKRYNLIDSIDFFLFNNFKYVYIR